MSKPHESPVEKWEKKLRMRMLRLLKLRVWIGETFQPGETQFALFWAGVVGFIGGGSSILFRWATIALNRFFTGEHQGGLVESFSNLSSWQCLLLPAAGGVMAGFVLKMGTLWRKESSTDYMEAIAVGDGVISARNSITKSLSAMFTIASGGSIGREGPLVQLAAMLASLVGRFGNWTATRRRLLVACGAAAGIAAAYNAPIAGSLFVAEIVLGSMAMEIFGPLVFSSVVSTLTVRGILGGKPLFAIPQYTLNSGWEIIPCLLLGLVAGALSPCFLALLRASERGFMRLRVPGYVRMGLGGLIVGSLAISTPQVCGNGYSTITSILHGGWVWHALLLILLLKVIATAATFGSGAVGGVFTPTLFVGACLGYLFGNALQTLHGFHSASPIAFALVGMAAFLAGTTHAPIMAMLMLFEMTLDYQMILPLMLASVTAYYTSLHFNKKSIYSESLSRKGALDFRLRLAGLHVADLMKLCPTAIRDTARFSEIARAFIQNRFNYLLVTDGLDHFRGAVSLHDVKSYLTEPELAELVIARDILHENFPAVSENDSLAEALDKFLHHDGEHLPVLDPNGCLAGYISKNDILLALAESPGGETKRQGSQE